MHTLRNLPMASEADACPADRSHATGRLANKNESNRLTRHTHDTEHERETDRGRTKLENANNIISKGEEASRTRVRTASPTAALATSTS